MRRLYFGMRREYEQKEKRCVCCCLGGCFSFFWIKKRVGEKRERKGKSPVKQDLVRTTFLSFFGKLNRLKPN